MPVTAAEEEEKRRKRLEKFGPQEAVTVGYDS
jgi:hypothetical protein